MSNMKIKFPVQKINKEIYKKSYLYNGIKLINEMSPDLRKTILGNKKVKKYKDLIKKWIRNKLDE